MLFRSRLMEQLRNFSGKPSVLVLRPADAAETSVAWQMAMENFDTPTALILSRQDIPDLPSADNDRYADAEKARRGGYVVMDNPDATVTLVANGSEVSLLCEVATLLDAENIPCRVVSVPSIGIFEMQDEAYRQSVIPTDIPTFGLTAGLPSTLQGVVGCQGEVFGLDHFGASAPYKVLDEKFGFTPGAVCARIKNFLGR